MEMKEHKEAILDISQRLNPDHYSWKRFAKELGLPDAEISRIYTQEPTEPEELYYRTLVEWIKLKEDEATFHFLLTVLRRCDSDHLFWCIRYRLGHWDIQLQMSLICIGCKDTKLVIYDLDNAIQMKISLHLYGWRNYYLLLVCPDFASTSQV